MRPAAAPSAQIVCSGCRTLLLYPAGAQNVRCAGCSTITTVAPQPPAASMAQLCCTNAQCRVVLLYPRGAAQVQCSVCGNLNDAAQANQLGHIVCGGCAVTLAFAHGAQSVKCSVCGCVTPATDSGGGRPGAQQQDPHAAAVQHAQHAQQHAQHAQQQQQQQHHAASTSSKPSHATVLVVNPGDESGPQTNVAIGVSRENK